MSTVARQGLRAPDRRRFEAERRLVIRGARWEDYVTLVDSLRERSPLRIAFDGKDLEIMTKGRDHERFSGLTHHLIVVVAKAQGLGIEPFGETTWRQPGIKRGLEADQWYFLDTAKRERIANIERREKSKGLRGRHLKGFPSPDLAVEIDLSPSEVDRPGIYAALRVVEVWRFDGDQAVIERLTPEGLYAPVERSGWLALSPADLVRWLLEEDTSEFIPWLDRLTRWARRRFAKRKR